MATSAAAFTVDMPLGDQIDIDNTGNVMLTDEGTLTLEKLEDNLRGLVLSPDFENDSTLFALTDANVYQNQSFDANFFINDYFPTEMLGKRVYLSMGSDYDEYGSMLMYEFVNDGGTGVPSVYISYNNGTTWANEDLTTEEPVDSAYLGPDFAQSGMVYFVTASGLYRQDVENDTSEQVYAGSGETMIKDLVYPMFSAAEDTYYIVEGSKVLKTENFGDDFFEYDAGSEIKKIVAIDDETPDGDIMILSGTDKLERSDDGLDYYEVSLPPNTAEVYDFAFVQGQNQSYIVVTDLGVYISYNDGYNWSKLNYDIEDYYSIHNLTAADINGDAVIFFTYQGKLYRDYKAMGTMEEYMTGIDSAQYYASSGMADSLNIVELSGETFEPSYMINEVTLWTDAVTNEQTLNYYVTTDDGTSWEQVTPNETYELINQGNSLKWRIEMATEDNQVSPVVNSMMVDFGFDEVPVADDGTCAGFSDITADDERCEAITYVKDQGIFEGYPDGTFGPDIAINRAETVKVISEGFDLEMLPDPQDNLGFSDVIMNEWYMPYLATAKSAGIIEGYPDGTFKPEQTVNYVELIKIFFETAGVELGEEGGEWYQRYLDYAVLNDYLVYDELEAGMERGDVAVLFYQHSQM